MAGRSAGARSLRVTGIVFAASFLAGVLLVGDQAGAFADSEAAFTELFAGRTAQLRGLLGSVLLLAAALSFGLFTQLVTPGGPGSAHVAGALVRTCGTLAAVALVVAAGAFLTVPASLTVGAVFDDPGIRTVQHLLPQFGYVMLVAGVALPAAVLMIASAKACNFPIWFGRATPVVAVVLLITASSVALLALLPLWVLIASFVLVALPEPLTVGEEGAR